MLINGNSLLESWPLKPMLASKQRFKGISFGLTEAGYDIRIKQSLTLSPNNRFMLASTVEEFNMPNDLVAVVHDKSTWARKGLSVFNTVIEPGWKGFLTLELVYHGNETLCIEEGSGIAQVLFHQLEESAAYNGKYQNQEDKPIEARYD